MIAAVSCRYEVTRWTVAPAVWLVPEGLDHVCSPSQWQQAGSKVHHGDFGPTGKEHCMFSLLCPKRQGSTYVL